MLIGLIHDDRSDVLRIWRKTSITNDSNERFSNRVNNANKNVAVRV